MVAPSADPAWIITLVHGTWGRGFFSLDKPTKSPRWFEAGSEFRHHLSIELETLGIPAPHFEVCKWSGSNSIAARESAARQLADQLESQQRLNPGRRQLVIAHSHGGNVAVRATTHLKSTDKHILVATLATPFIEIFPRSSILSPSPVLTFVYLAANVMLGVFPFLFLTGIIKPLTQFWLVLYGPLALIAIVAHFFFNSTRQKKKRDRLGKQLVQHTSHEGLTPTQV
ncbi:hypothetical protein E4K64_30675 [Bradyrhizobium frederickii]|nr:alpha/beta hydrolase [Bradyrhizobium frederickii]TFV70223.1 hypothetical protein E4K64_30675 [Bradyrhizobium frederickii]